MTAHRAVEGMPQLQPRARLQMIWQLVVRMVVGSYWLYFSYQKWFDRSWVKDMIAAAAEGSYVPVYRELLRTVAVQNWDILAFIITLAEGVVGVMILSGVLTRIAATAGALLSANLIMTFVLCNCSWTVADFPLIFWFYFAPLMLTIQVFFDESSNVFGLKRLFKRIAGGTSSNEHTR